MGYAEGVTSSPYADPTWVTGIPGVPGAVLARDTGAGLRAGIPGVPGAVLMQDGTVGLRERKKVATRRALGLAAMRLAVERGLENVLVEDIAEAAGVSTRRPPLPDIVRG